MFRSIIATILAASAATVLPAEDIQYAGVMRVDRGVIVTPNAGPAKRVRVLVYGDGLFRVSAVPGEDIDNLPKSLMVTAAPAGDFTIKTAAGLVTIRTARGSAEIRTSDGRVLIRDAAGVPVLTESRRGSFVPVTIDGKSFVATQQQFNPGTDEGFYGLGQHQNGQMNYNGEDVELAQHNTDIAVPFVVSTRNYGLLWDNNSITRFGNPTPYRKVGDDSVAAADAACRVGTVACADPNDHLAVTSDGKSGWKADYYLDGKLAVSRRESVIDYQFYKDRANWPAAAKSPLVSSANGGQKMAQKQTVVWTGTLNAGVGGVQKFRLYASGYFKVYADGKLVVDDWRQDFMTWFHNFEVPMTIGKPVAIRVEWQPDQSFITLLHSDPMPAVNRHSLWMSSDVGKGIDYYVVAGAKNMDDVVAGYRSLTGKASMMPQWAYGYWQSRERYKTQNELLGVLREYRKRDIPIDNIVQDWYYWREDQWGSHDFDRSRFPDAKAMVDEVHALNAHIMISVWPKFYPNTDNAKALDAQGWLYQGNLLMGNKDWVGAGYASTVYDAYAPDARKLYFSQIKDKLVDKGFDAWWLDATEPELGPNLSHADQIAVMGPTARGPAAQFFNSYPLVHVEGIAEGLRVARPDVRPFILTRSGFGGMQRASAAVWSGDTASRWSTFRNQISAGVNLSMSGLPNWTHDIGGFTPENRYIEREPAAVPEWRELYLRWFQFGAFSPLFRSHGTGIAREIYEISADDTAMQASLIWYDKLRYRLMPYIYTLAADTYQKDGSMMRGLVMDFSADKKTWSINDEYLFGKAFLVAPVTEFKARRRAVYLPAGAGWYDFATGT
jgi:alpha-D-xyloside xylohydrolase